jgi:predicted small lipoprotein YifL
MLHVHSRFCVAFLLGALASSAGCGKKGPLYLPEARPPAATQPAAPGADGRSPKAQPDDTGAQTP